MGAKKWCPFFFFEEDGRPNKKKERWSKKWATKIKIEYLKKVKENVPRSQKYHPSVATGRPPQKKRWAVDGQCAKMCPPNKNEEDGLPIKKKWGIAHLFEVNFWRPSFAYPY